MITCESCGGVGYFSWATCSEPGCCGEGRDCEFCNGDGVAPSVIITEMPDWYGVEDYDTMGSKVNW